MFSDKEITKIKYEHNTAIESVFDQMDSIEKLVLMAKKSLDLGGKILWCGNGGSAADAQHMAAELMVRYKKNRPPLASIALTTDSSLITAHSNDFEYESVFSRQIEALGHENDLIIVLTTSGASKNIIMVAEQARKMNINLVCFIGKNDSPLSAIADLSIAVNSFETARIQEGHTLIGHLFCEGLDRLY